MSPGHAQRGPSAATRARTALRLAAGAARLEARGSWADRRACLERCDTLSTDVFGTLLLQAEGIDDATLDELGRDLAAVLAADGHAMPCAPDAVPHVLGELHARLRTEERARHGPDREVSLFELCTAFAAQAGAGAAAHAIAEAVVARALAWQRAWTRPDAEALELLAEAKRLGKRVVAVSDTTLRERDLRALFELHGITLVDAVYASCERGATKFHGSLFARMLEAERVAPERVLHVGDDGLADVASARAAGITALHRPRARARLEPDAARADDPYFALGFRALGPIFGAFALLLLQRAKHERLGRLAFVARDGELLREVTIRFVQGANVARPPGLDYVYFSRRSTAMPRLARIDASTLATVASIRAGGPLGLRLLAYCGLENVTFPADLDRMLRSDTGQLSTVLEDPRFAALVEAERARQRGLLRDYLRQAGLFGRDDVALVDIGWRATIQSALNETFADEPGFRPIKALYLGLWSEEGTPPDGVAQAEGLLADGRRGRGLHEAAAWQLAFVLEAVCRASHGTVTGYARAADGTIEPTLGPAAATTRACAGSSAEIARLREGILAYAEAFGARIGPALRVPRGLRARTQAHMIELAFLPGPEAIALLGELVRIESLAGEWSVPLIASDRPAPWVAPRRWLRGLASPWRSGYVAATGGPVLASLFAGSEGLLSRVPALRLYLQRTARRWAGIRDA